MSSKAKKVAKVTRKPAQRNSRRATEVKAKGKPQKSAYTEMNGSFRVLFPLAQTKTSKKVLAEAVSSVVERMKD